MLTLALRMLLLAAAANAQEKPVYHVPSWRTDVSYRHNFCQQHEAVERGDLQLRDALRGLNLTVGVYSYQLNQETGAIDEENPDIAIEFLDELSRRAGFSYRQTYGLVDSPSENETWTDVLYSSTDVYDVTGDWYIENTERLENNILYPEGWLDANYIMVMRTEESTDFNLFAFTLPFTPAVWGMIALMTIFSGLVYYVLDYFDSRIKRRPMDVGLESSLFLTAFTFNGHYAHQPKSRSTRILVFSMAFFFLLIVACYTANLASFLVVRNRRVVVNDIQDAIRNDLTFCVEKASPYEDFLRTFRVQPKNLVLTETPANEKSQSHAYLGLLEGKCDIVFTARGIFDEFRRSERFNPDCSIEFVGRIQKFLSGGFALKDSEQYCASIVRDALHLHMYEMKGTPVYNSIWENFLSKAATNTCDADPSSGTEDESFASMGLANLGGMFLMHAIALFVALGVTLFQICQQPSYRKKAMITEFKRGLFGSTTLNRVVEQSNRETDLSFSTKQTLHTDNSSRAFGKNNQTNYNEDMEFKSHSMKLRGYETSHTDKVQMTGTVPNVTITNLTVTDLSDRIEEIMEFNQQQKALMEMLLQKVEKMENKIENFH